MPAFPSRSFRALALALALLAGSAAASQNGVSQAPFAAAAGGSVKAADGCLSCSGCSDDACATNQPGGLLLLTSFWDYSPSTGPDDSWTIHGLWPDNCDGSYDASCDSSRNHGNIAHILQQAGATDTLDYMNQYWVDINGNDNSFWSHEWNKHGTCVSTLEPKCYQQTEGNYTTNEDVVDFFNVATQLWSQYPLYDWLAQAGITPSTTKTYTLDELHAVVNAQFGHDWVFRCRSGHLNEAWAFFNTRGRSTSVDSFVPADPIESNNNCPRTGIIYLPK